MVNEQIEHRGKYHAIFNAFSFGFLNAFSYFHITNQRVVRKEGILTRDIDEWVLNRISAVEVDQGIWGKVLGYGTVKLYRSGEKTPILFTRISDPQAFRRAINRAKGRFEIPNAT